MDFPPLAEMCKAVRKATHLSQIKMAELIETNQTEISFIEQGFIPEDKDKIDRIKELYERYNND